MQGHASNHTDTVLAGEPTDPAGPVAYYATTAVHATVMAMRKAGVPDLSRTKSRESNAAFNLGSFSGAAR
jgi:pyrrolidone-carboxylate peptidase